MDAEIAAGHCSKHPDRLAVVACEDCRVGLCRRCRVDIDTVGTFCWECAARRGGLRAGRRPLHAGAPPPVFAIPGGSFEHGAGVRQFEKRVGDRPSRHLISGLTEALAEAGTDPLDVVDDDALVAEIGHLQDLAAEDDRTASRWRRRR